MSKRTKRSNKIYSGLVAELERIERNGNLKLKGNNLAHKLTDLIEYRLLTPKEQVIFNVIYTRKLCSVSDIAIDIRNTSSNVSACLCQLLRKTNLFTKVIDDNGKHLYKLQSPHHFNKQ